MTEEKSSISHEARQRLQNDAKRDAARTHKDSYDVREHMGQDAEAVEEQIEDEAS
jgi:hypothetical protein